MILKIIGIILLIIGIALIATGFIYMLIELKTTITEKIDLPMVQILKEWYKSSIRMIQYILLIIAGTLELALAMLLIGYEKNDLV